MDPLLPPPLDRTARWCTALGVGPAGARCVRAWAAGGTDGRDVDVREAADLAAALAAVDEAVAGARVGWRLLVAGPAGDVAAVRARALARGAVPDEVVAHAVGEGPRLLWCARCRSTAPESGPTCAACGTPLRVEEHVSARLAAHLAVPVPP